LIYIAKARFSDLALDGSNYYKACVWDYDYFPLELPIQVVFQSPLDYENKETQAAIGNLMEMIVFDILFLTRN
jgi:hypothetical protein